METAQHIVAWAYIVIYTIEILGQPFYFGKARSPYSPKGWLITVLLSLPIVWLLITFVS